MFAVAGARGVLRAGGMRAFGSIEPMTGMRPIAADLGHCGGSRKRTRCWRGAFDDHEGGEAAVARAIGDGGEAPQADPGVSRVPQTDLRKLAIRIALAWGLFAEVLQTNDRRPTERHLQFTKNYCEFEKPITRP